MLGKVFGANVDWISQHSVFPEYFRQQFYETGQFFPEFAANIGGGQNIYHFAYYGLYNSLNLPAYLLPFVKMSDYMMAVSILCILVDMVLLYRWFRGNGASKGNSGLAALLFLLAGPMVFHSYSQIMFVNYMPFLILGFIGIDRYFRKNKSGLLVMSVFLMIMTSFYFSIGGILALGIYGIFRYWSEQEEKGKRITGRGFLFAGVQFSLRILTSVFMSGVLLVPTAMALFSGERGAKVSVSFPELFLPQMELGHVLYDPYGIGLPTIVITVLFTGVLYQSWREKYLHLACLVIIGLPIFRYLLNGGLYIRGKVLIPMLPLCCYLILMYLEKQKRREISFGKGMFSLALTVLLVWIGSPWERQTEVSQLLFVEAILMLFFGMVFYRVHMEKILMVVPLISLLLFGTIFSLQENRMLDQTFYEKVTSQEYAKKAEKILRKEQGFYRMEQSGTLEEDAANINRIWSMEQYVSSVYSSTYHEGYQDFRKNSFKMEQPYRNILMQAGAKNPVFQRFMGIKYVLSDQDVPGYRKVAEGVYENNSVLPIAYGTDRNMTEETYRKLSFPYNQIALLKYAVVEEAEEDGQKKFVEQPEVKNVALSLEDKRIQKKKKIKSQVQIPKASEGDIFFLQFEVKNHHPSKDVSVIVEGVRNKLTAKQHIYYNENETFTYAIALRDGQTSLDVTFGEGNYDICNVKGYIWADEVQASDEKQFCRTEFRVDKEKTKGNVIQGSIEMEKDGYLITSIPYDRNFEVCVDGKQVTHEKVNTAFLGMELEKGEHEITMIYHAPGVTVGKVMSLLGFFLFLGIGKLNVLI